MYASWTGTPPSPFSPLLLLIPICLGREVGERGEQLGKLLQMEQCVGLIVGQPPRAYFAIGSQPPLLLCLDPHTVSAYTPLRDDEHLDAYHCREPVAIHVGTLAPSVLAGFYW